MAGQPRTRAKRQAAQGPFYATTVGDSIRWWDAAFGAAPQDPEAKAISDATSELASAVAHKARLAKLAQTDQWAEQVLNPQTGADPVSTEALQTAVAAHKDVSGLYRQEAADARQAAAHVDERVSAAQRSGYEVATAAASGQIAAVKEVAGLAITAVKESGAAQAEAARAAGAAQAQAAQSQAAFFQKLAESLLGVQTQQQAPPANPLSVLVDAANALKALGIPIGQPTTAQGMSVDDAIRMGWFTHTMEQDRKRTEAGAKVLEQIPSFLDRISSFLPGARRLPSAAPTAAVNGIPNAPPPRPGLGI